MAYQVNPKTGVIEQVPDANPWLTNLPALITAGSSIAGGIAAGGANAAARAQTQYEREQQARQAQMNWLQSQLNMQEGRAAGLADRMPLGSEQSYVQSQGLLGGAAGALRNQTMPTVYGGVVNPFAGMDLTPYGTGATATALAERRKALAGIDPNFQFGSMGSYGLQGPEVTGAEQQVAQYARDVASQRMAQEQAMTNMLNAQYRAATGQGEPGAAGAAPAKKGGFWSGLGKTLLKVAPIALSAVPGIGTGLGMALQAGLGAAGGAAGGGGLKGAILGGATGAAGAKLGGVGAPKGTSFLSNLQKAVLSPKGIAQVVSATAPGAVGQAAGVVAPLLKGATYGPDRTANTGGPFGPTDRFTMPIRQAELIGSQEDVAGTYGPLPAGSSGNPFLDGESPAVQAVKPPSARAKTPAKPKATQAPAKPLTAEEQIVANEQARIAALTGQKWRKAPTPVTAQTMSPFFSGTNMATTQPTTDWQRAMQRTIVASNARPQDTALTPQAIQRVAVAGPAINTLAAAVPAVIATPFALQAGLAALQAHGLGNAGMSSLDIGRAAVAALKNPNIVRNMSANELEALRRTAAQFVR